MAISNITLSSLNPQSLAMAKAGMTPTLTPEQSKGYSILFTILSGGEEWDSSVNPVMSVFGGKIYLPKVYQKDGDPFVQWGPNLYELPDSDQLSLSYATANTGYSSPHLMILFTPDKNVKGAKVIYQTAFPVGMEAGEQNAADFLSLVAVNEEEAFKTYVRRPDPVMGLVWLDDAAEADTKEVKVTVVEAVTRKGSEEYGGKHYTTAVVLAPSIHPTQKFKVRTNSDANATLQGPLKFPLNVDGVVRRAKKNLNLQEMVLKPENIDMGALVV